MIYFFCDCCGKKFGITENLIGRKGECPDCGTVFTVPTKTQSAPFGGQIQGPREDKLLAKADGEAQGAGSPSGGSVALTSPEWGAEAPPVPPAAAKPARVPSSTPPKRDATRLIAALPALGPSPPSRTGPRATAFAPPPSTASSPPSTASSPPSATVPRRPPTAVVAAAPPSARPPQRPPTARVSAVQTSESQAREPVSTCPSEPARRSGAGRGVAVFVIVGLLASLAFIWKGGGFGGGDTATSGPTDPSPARPPVAPPPPVETPGPTPDPPTPPPDPAPPTDPPHVDPDPAPPVDPPHVDPTPEPAPPTPSDPPTPEPAPPDPPTPEPAPPANPPTPEPALASDEVSKALKEAQEGLRTARLAQDTARMARSLDPLRGVLRAREVVQYLGKLLLASPEDPAVRQRAAEMLGEGGRPEAVSLLDRGARAAHDVEAVANAAISALGRIEDAAGTRKLEDLVRGRLVPAADERENLYAIAAIEALGRGKRLRNVETLMGLYLTLAQLYPGEQPPRTDEDARNEFHRLRLEEATRAALSSITGQSFRSYAEWAEWWQANRGNYK